MNKNNKDLDAFFKGKLTSEKSAYSFNQNDWDVLEQKLNLNKKKRRQHVLLFRTLVGAAAVLLIFFSIWMINVNEFGSVSQDTLELGNTPPETHIITQESRERIEKDVKEVRANEYFANRSQDALTSKEQIPSVARRGLDESIMAYTLNQVTKPDRNPFGLRVNPLPTDYSNRLNYSLKAVGVRPDPDRYIETKSRKNVVLSILVAPSLNGVNGFKDGEVGGDFGFLVAVDVSKKLSVSTGAVYAKKLYEADFDRNIYPKMGRYEYGGYGGAHEYGNTKVFPESVYADCRVLDIPLNVNYSLLNKGKNKISIGTGMSSYIMLKEKYQFEYAEQKGVNAEKLELTNENKHVMSVLNFQASYTRQLNSNVGISLQPYLKIPLIDIGYAETKLRSIGMAVNINFSLSSNRK